MDTAELVVAEGEGADEFGELSLEGGANGRGRRGVDLSNGESRRVG